MNWYMQAVDDETVRKAVNIVKKYERIVKRIIKEEERNNVRIV
jgi:hypothetical protein